MFCQKCGTSLADGEIFCHECGTRQAAVVNSLPVNTLSPAQNPNSVPAYASVPVYIPVPVAVDTKKSHSGVIAAVISVIVVVAVILVLVFTGVIGGSVERKLIGTWKSAELDQGDDVFYLTFEKDGEGYSYSPYSGYKVYYDWEYDKDSKELVLDVEYVTRRMNVKFLGKILFLIPVDEDGDILTDEIKMFVRKK